MKVQRYKIILMLTNFSTGLLVSVFSLIMLDKGLTLGGIALAIGLYSVTAAVLEIPSGIAADILGRKRTFMISLFVSASAFSVLLLMHGPVWVMIAIALTGAGKAMASGTIESLFISRYISSYGMDRLPKAMRILALSESVGIASGALLGGFLPTISALLPSGIGTYDLNLLLRVVLCLILAGLTGLLIPCDRGERPERLKLTVHLRESVRLVRKSHTLKWLLMATAGLGIALCALESYWQPLLLGLLGGGEQKTTMLGVLSMLYFGAVIAGNLVSEKLLSRHIISEKTMFIAGRVAMIASIVGAALVGQPVVFMVFYCLMYFFLGASNISEGALMHREVTDRNRASMISTQSFMMQLGMLIFSLGAGTLVVTYSIQVMWVAAAAISTLLLLPSLLFIKQKIIRTELSLQHVNIV
ncbi:MAG: MFS transporter [Saccharofermentanales bacterium]